jgi:Zn finger protein HypA/HybF involved in hydrogenase expression
LDIIEDSRFYQNRCKRRYGRPKPEAVPAAPETPAKEAPAGEEFTVTEVRQASASTRARAARAGYAARSASRKRLKVMLVVLPLLAVAVGAVGVKVILSRSTVDPSTYVRISCTKCEGADEKYVPNIHEARCPKCGSPAGFTFECRDCGTVFPVIPDRSVKTVVDIGEFPACPKCGGTKTRPVKTNPPPES